MKIIAGILAFVILFLAVQPAFASFMKVEEVECSSDCCKHDTTNQQSDDQACSDFCNPLLKCGTCAIGNMEFINFVIDAPVFLLDKPLPLPQSLFSQFAPDFWQPPKLLS